MDHPPCLSCADPSLIFVFGSNAQGHHAGRAAHHALEAHGAFWGRGQGLQGDSYAINTMSGEAVLKLGVAVFVAFAHSRPDMRFFVTAIGCGIAGYAEDQISPLFADAPPNCILPTGWRTK